MRKNPNAQLAGGLPRTQTTLPEVDSAGFVIGSPERDGECGLVDNDGNLLPRDQQILPPPTVVQPIDEEFIGRLRAWVKSTYSGIRNYAYGNILDAIEKEVSGILDALRGKRRRGRPKSAHAKTSTQRSQEHRKRKRSEAEQQQIDERVDRLAELAPRSVTPESWNKKTIRTLLNNPESRKQLLETPQQFYDRWVAALDSSDTQGRQRNESTKSGGDLEKIFGAKSRDGSVTDDSYDDTDQGRRVRSEGYGSYGDQEGFATGAAASSRNIQGHAAILPPAQEAHGTGARSSWLWRQYIDKDENIERASAIREFVEQSFSIVSESESQPIVVDNENEDEDEEFVETELHCKLPINESTNYQRAPRGTPCPEVFLAHGYIDGDNRIQVYGDEWDEAVKHVCEFHERELRRYLRQTLPAWAKGSSRSRIFKGKPFTGECPRKVDHEKWRLKAVERGDKERMQCPFCQKIIYAPFK